MFALTFPPLSHLTKWPDFALKGTPFAMNKIFIIYVLSAIFTILIFVLGNKKRMVPSGVQQVAEMSVEFIEDGIAKQTMSVDSRKYIPFMSALFFFILFTNLFEIIPVFQMPASARIALPLVLALSVFFVWIVAGMASHGPGRFFKHMLVPNDVPVGLLPIIVPIEIVSNFVVKPFSHMVRLFANLLAGHILLVAFTVLSAALWTAKPYAAFLPLPVFGVIFFVAFEILVSFLQAYVFTLLTGVYIDQAASHEG